VKRWLFLTHRWLGVFGCLLIVLWFTSGFVMMYVPFPTLSDGERLAALPQIDGAQLRVTPAQALAAVARTTPASRVVQLRLLQPADAPVYALRVDGQGWVGLDARSGEPLRVDPHDAQRSAERFAGQAALSVERIERDQWSVSGSLDPHRPLFAVTMADGGLHYVSSRTGEVVRDTQRAERGWNWIGAVVHWVYPTALRSRPGAWHWTVIVLSGYALLTAVLGTVVGLLRFRRYASGKRSPYAGWMRWHHLLGLAAALFVLAWLFSGLMSMNPGDVFSPRGLAPQQLQAWGGGAWQPTLPALEAGAKEVEWLADPAGTVAWLRRAPDDSPLQRDGRPVVIDEAFLRTRLAALELGDPIDIERLDTHDLHYHARNAPRPLPVWRVRFADARQTWVHFDGQTGQPFGRIDASNRAGRWLYHGLHSWDFEPLLQRRPLWDVLMLAAMALGTAFSATSVVIAWRRLQTDRRKPSASTARRRALPTLTAPSFD
jgi:hypothetical protein